MGCACALLLGLLLTGCSSQPERPKGPAGAYLDTTDAFSKARYDRALDVSARLASANPANEYTNKACVLRSVILIGEINGFKKVADSYEKGADATKNPRFKSEYLRMRTDALQAAGERALQLGEVEQRLATPGPMPSPLVLDAPYPGIEGPVAIAQFTTVEQGGWIEPTAQEQVALDAPRMGVDDSLAELLGGDRAAARTKMSTGAVKLDGAAYALYLADGLSDAASIYDHKHLRDVTRFRMLTGLADNMTNTAAESIKQSPNPDAQARLKKLQAQLKSQEKNG
jgi:hypothetical protein